MLGKRKREGPCAYRDILTLSPPGTTPQARGPKSPSYSSVSLNQAAVLNERVAQHVLDGEDVVPGSPVYR